ncbi:MAG: hypothetical protein J6Y02_08830 [Pseudobutyrivibrio sp.]|nr:hypothetical protein [Pseudobutyrivibrio sp.]
MMGTFYDAPNDYRNYLAHYGIKGQKWGVKNGPPYPLTVSKMSQRQLNELAKDYSITKNENMYRVTTTVHETENRPMYVYLEADNYGAYESDHIEFLQGAPHKVVYRPKKQLKIAGYISAANALLKSYGLNIRVEDFTREQISDTIRKLNVKSDFQQMPEDQYKAIVRELKNEGYDGCIDLVDTKYIDPNDLDWDTVTTATLIFEPRKSCRFIGTEW